MKSRSETLKLSSSLPYHIPYMFRLRTRMVKVGHNFGRKILCPLCGLHSDDQKGLLECMILKINCKELYLKNNKKYEDIFSENIKDLKNISALMQKIPDVREELLDCK